MEGNATRSVISTTMSCALFLAFAVAVLTVAATAKILTCDRLDIDCERCRTYELEPGVCLKTSSTASEKYVCSPDEVYFYSYDNSDCQGRPYVTTYFGKPNKCNYLDWENVFPTCPTVGGSSSSADSFALTAWASALLITLML